MVTSLQSARISAIVYSDRIKTLDGFKFVTRIENNETNSTCALYQKDETVIIAFKGTDSTKDIPVMMRFTKEKMEVRGYGTLNCKIHRGFLASYRSLHDDIIASLDELSFTHIHLTGHSLGGALAEISAIHLRGLATKITAHTFAAPQIGNNDASKIAYSACDEFRRFVIDGDFIPLLPSFLLGYSHYTNKIKLDRVNSKIIENRIYSAVNSHRALNYVKSVMIYEMEKIALVEKYLTL